MFIIKIRQPNHPSGETAVYSCGKAEDAWQLYFYILLLSGFDKRWRQISIVDEDGSPRDPSQGGHLGYADSHCMIEFNKPADEMNP